MDMAIIEEINRKQEEREKRFLKATSDIDALKKSAEQGDIESIVFMGEAYESGTGVDKSLEESFKWFKIAAEKGHVASMCCLATRYNLGIGITKSIEDANNWYNLAADNGDVSSMVHLMNEYNDKKDATSHDKAIHWCKRITELEGSDYLLFDAEECEEEGEDEDAFSLYLLLAECDVIQAMGPVADMYRDGRGTTQSNEKTLEWYKKAIEKGDTYSMFRLGQIYEYGMIGVPLSYEKALEMYQLALDNGDADAYWAIGDMYENGYGVSKSLDKAIEYYEKGADQGSGYSMHLLGMKYFTGEGVQESKELAYDWFIRAAELGTSESQFACGVFHENGICMEKSFEKAYDWYALSAEQDNIEAICSCALLCEKGLIDDSENRLESLCDSIEDENLLYEAAELFYDEDGVYHSYSLAAKSLEIASDCGNTDASYLLGTMYENGIGVEKSMDRAVELYDYAAIYGEHADAAFKLAVLYEKGKSVEKDIDYAAELYEIAANGGIVEAMFKIGYMYEKGKGVDKDYETAIEWYDEAYSNGHEEAWKRSVELERKIPDTDDD